MDISVVAGGDELYRDVFFGNLENVDTAMLDVSTLTIAEVDAYGYLKPGTPLQLNNNLLSLISGAGQTIHTVVPHAAKLRGRTDNANLSTDTRDLHVACPVTGAVQQKAIEFNLGRALTTDEKSAFAAAGCKIKLVP